MEGDLLVVSCGPDTVLGDEDGGVALAGEACCDCLTVSASLSGAVQMSRACAPCFCEGADPLCVTTVSCDVAHQEATRQCCPGEEELCVGGIYGGPACLCSSCNFDGHFHCGNVQCVAITETKKITVPVDPFHDKSCGFGEGCYDPDSMCDVPCDDPERICTECLCGDYFEGECNDQTCLKSNVDCPGFSCACVDAFPDDLQFFSFEAMASLHRVIEGGENDCFEEPGYYIVIWIYLQITCKGAGGGWDYPAQTHDFFDTGIIFFLGTTDPKGTSNTFNFTESDLEAGSPFCGLEALEYTVDVTVT